MDEKKAGDLRKMNAAALAYIGDAVYEAAVRESCIRAGKALSADRLHSAAVRYVRASAQAKAMRALFSALNAEDALLVKRAKNRKPRSIPKNA
ncbi:MAG: ribonuclease III, partial [Clostridiales Family XIII bacterium]|nr:ribonuclease III [Clostridiales Family XIII bacterium]